MGYCRFLSWSTAGSYYGVLQVPVMGYCRFLLCGTLGSYHGVLQVPVMGYCRFLSWGTAGSYHRALQVPIMGYCRFLSWGTVGSYHGVLQVPIIGHCRFLTVLARQEFRKRKNKVMVTKHTKQSYLPTVQWPQSTNVASFLNLQHTNAYSDRQPY